ncbi:MAG: DNRLRE domain-containing protein [Candidatus Lokiarchaeota archaeon]|nr:DNRLRE domain-containing protein [Candidatus Lokiarchaeota archaeon]
MKLKNKTKVFLFLIVTFNIFPYFVRGQAIQTIYPTKDAFVSDTYPNDNFGTHPWLWICNWDNLSSGICQSYIYFNLPSDYQNYKTVNLHFYVLLLDTIHMFNISFYRINQGWDELTINWSGKPPLNDFILTKEVEDQEIYDIDIKSHLTSRVFSIGIVAADSRLNFAEIASKEHGSVTSDQKLAVVLNNEEFVIIMSVVGIVVISGAAVIAFFLYRRKKARNKI